VKILLVLTSHGQLGDTGKPTGFWLEELAAPYYVFKDAGAELVLASPKGGQPPIDPKSDEPDARSEATRRLRADRDAMQALANTRPLASVDADEFDAVFYPGGHGPLWDLAESQDSRALIESMLAAGKPVAAVCHAPGVLRHVQSADGAPLVRGKRVTGFTNSEEEAVGLVQVVPFLVEDMLETHGGHFSKGPDWQPHVVTDGLLVTGQNPASSAGGAEALLKVLRANTAPQGASAS
jgi:putative intracellular protease/amidase